jgi:hypothetical protein
MADTSPPHSPPKDQSPRESKVAYLDQTLWQQLAEAETTAEFCQSWLVLQCRMIDGVSSGVVVLGPPDEGPFVPEAFWPKDLKDRKSLSEITERVLKELKGVLIKAKTNDATVTPDKPHFQLAYPIKEGEKLYGVAALEMAFRPQEQLQTIMRQLQWGVAWMQNWILRKDIDSSAVVNRRLITALDLAAVALQEERFQAAASSFVTLLASRHDCDRVSIGFVKGEKVKVCSLSHSAEFGKQMNLIRAIGAAMDEGLDQQEIIVYPSVEESHNLVIRAHEELAVKHGDGAICTIPFSDADGKGYGALTLERSVEHPFDTETVELCDSVAALIGPILEEKRKNDRLFVKKAVEASQIQLQRLIGPGHMARKLIAAAFFILVIFFSFATGDYRVTSSTTIEGVIQRVVSAPYDGYIYEADTRAGDIVKKGHVMCSLDDRDLRLERLKWAGQRDQHLRQYREAMAESSRAKMKIFKEQINQAEAQLALLDEQLSRVKLVAPFDGLVVSGDLSQSLGAPVERGKVLFEVAPLNAYRVMLQVDEREISQIKVGQDGDLVLNAFPGTYLPISVEKITPVSVQEEGRNYFRVEARLIEASDRLRPGMEGIGKVYVDRRKLIWIWTHEMIDWLRLWVWSWWR